MKPEAKFEHELTKIAPLFGCRYVKIPDSKSINRNNRYSHREEKRPFDAILITPNGNFCIECKINSGKLLTHQERNGQMINEINQSFYIIRKRIRTYETVYQVEQPEKNVIFETKKIEELFTFFIAGIAIEDWLNSLPKKKE